MTVKEKDNYWVKETRIYLTVQRRCWCVWKESSAIQSSACFSSFKFSASRFNLLVFIDSSCECVRALLRCGTRTCCSRIGIHGGTTTCSGVWNMHVLKDCWSVRLRRATDESKFLVIAWQSKCSVFLFRHWAVPRRLSKIQDYSDVENYLFFYSYWFRSTRFVWVGCFNSYSQIGGCNHCDCVYRQKVQLAPIYNLRLICHVVEVFNWFVLYINSLFASSK